MKVFAKFILVSLLMLTISGMAVANTATDDEGVVNDPFQNPRANACYSEGAECKNENEWRLGWYHIRYQTGFYKVAGIPAGCYTASSYSLDFYWPGGAGFAYAGYDCLSQDDWGMVATDAGFAEAEAICRTKADPFYSDLFYYSAMPLGITVDGYELYGCYYLI